MGTNYYLHQKPKCSGCGRPQDDRLHIGKSSGGWCFSLHAIPELGIHDLPDWERLWSQEGAWIVDEYGSDISVHDMYSTITERASVRERKGVPLGYTSWTDFYNRNYGAPGPNGLIRHQLGPYCLKHGAGTWDMIPGEFS